MPKPVRPPWWSGAVYRVALTGWATSMSRVGPQFNGNSPPDNPEAQFALDALPPEDELITRYIQYQEGQPALTGADGSFVSLSVPNNILNHCADVLEEDSSMRLADGIKRKLRVFAESWKDCS